ncbi:MAG: hypothetical protein GY861_05680 [bacterium]|nr:hypothetical protein [bacterium]
MILYYQDTHLDGECIDDISGEDFCESLDLNDGWLGSNMEIIYVGF